MNRLNEYNKKRNFDKTQEPKGILKKENKKNMSLLDIFFIFLYINQHSYKDP